MRRFDPHRLFNPLPRKVLRRHVGGGEIAATICCGLGLIGVCLWVAGRGADGRARDQFLPPPAVAESSMPDQLYHEDPPPNLPPQTGGGREMHLPAQAVGGREMNLAPFPPEILAGGWRLEKGVETYTPDTLFEKIDGAAEQYLSFGCRGMAFAALANGGDSLTVELYDHATFANALGIFAAQRGATAPVTESAGARYYETQVGAIGVVGARYVKIVGSAPGSAVVAKARAVLAALAALPEMAAAVPHLYRLLSGAAPGVTPGSVTYERQDVFQLGFLRDFWFAGKPAAGDQARYFLHDAGDSAAAQKLLERFLGEQEYEYRTVAPAGSWTVMEHQVLHTFFAVGSAGAIVFGIDAAESRQRADAAMAELREALAHGTA
ncbi:MAG: hypothetical protein HYV63_10950 [Candidatus Schekmanbacteria bacterium]|nr:hypothetical protein [Candidatus Schekmanbacteria bacterium]